MCDPGKDGLNKKNNEAKSKIVSDFGEHVEFFYVLISVH